MRNVAAFPPAGPTITTGRKTYHDGANEVRSSILAELRDDIKKTKSEIVKRYIRKKIAWVLRHNERTDARVGGLGRK